MEREGKEGWRGRGGREREREREGGRESEGGMEREKGGREGIMLLSCTCTIIHNIYIYIYIYIIYSLGLGVIGGFKSRPRQLSFFPLKITGCFEGIHLPCFLIMYIYMFNER